MITKNILLSSLMAAGFALPAMAATPSSSQAASTQGAPVSGQASSGQSPAMNATGQQISARLRKSLSDAGFTDIRIMPQSFLVHAKDKDGDPVMMVVNPDSITAVTAMNNGATSGKNASPSSSGSGTAATQPKTTSD